MTENQSERQKRMQICKDQIATWQNRARMANQQGNQDLVVSALAYKRRYECELAELEGRDPPPIDFGGLSRMPPGNPPLNPSGVPRQPRPSTGSTSAALPLPDPENDENDRTES
jgi:hypothetical protein